MGEEGRRRGGKRSGEASRGLYKLLLQELSQFIV